MAYTILQVEKKTGISSHTLRFWAKKGLFPFVERDGNLVRYFSEKDIEWARWVNYFRKSKMDIKTIKKYVDLALLGNTTAKDRLEILQNQKRSLQNTIEELQDILYNLDYKISIYNNLVQDGSDALNPESQEYVGCETYQCQDYTRAKRNKKAL